MPKTGSTYSRSGNRAESHFRGSFGDATEVIIIIIISGFVFKVLWLSRTTG